MKKHGRKEKDRKRNELALFWLPEIFDPENITVTLETLERADESRKGVWWGRQQQWHRESTDGDPQGVVRWGVRMFAVSAAVEGKGDEDLPEEDWKRKLWEVKADWLLGLLQVSRGKAMNRNSIARAGKRNNSFRVERALCTRKLKAQRYQTTIKRKLEINTNIVFVLNHKTLHWLGNCKKDGSEWWRRRQKAGGSTS